MSTQKERLHTKENQLLLIGNHNSVFIIELATRLKNENPFWQIYIYSTSKEETISERYSDTKIQIAAKRKERKHKLINAMDLMVCLIGIPKFMKTINCQVCSIQGAFWPLGILAKKIKNNCKNLILTFWGTDFYRMGKLQRFFLLRLTSHADLVTATNKETLDKIKESLAVKNYKVTRFGLTPLDHIRSSKIPKDLLKKNLGIDSKKIAIVCGYNASQNQQHAKIILEISKIPKDILLNCFLIFPVTYGGALSYIEEIKALASNLPCKCLFIKDFMNSERVAMLCLATEIMIQLQKTDQFSGSMQEFIFAKNIVISGSWLPYNTLTSNGVELLLINDFDELGEALIEAIFLSKTGHTPKGQEVIWDLSSWEKNIENWSHVLGPPL